MAEIELSVMSGQCVKGRMGTHARLAKNIRAWEEARNTAEVKICWKFTVDDARRKFKYGTELS
jgi:hypothetical protein